jgi:mannose/fructose/N-acetylgalactosamine-specific phosphotransferase system component IIC
MRWLKVGAIGVGILIAFLVLSSVVGFLVEAVLAVLVVAAIVFAVKMALPRKQVSRKRSDRQVRGPRFSSPPRRQGPRDVDDDLARLKRETGG